MQTITIQANESFIKKIVSILETTAKAEDEKIDIKFQDYISEPNQPELSPKDEARFRDTLDKYYKGELNFITLDELKAKIKAKGL